MATVTDSATGITTTYYYVTNLQGDVTAILNTAGAPVVTYTYDAWGNILSANGTMADSLGTLNPLRYRSYVYDHETGLYYLQSRYYDPELGRFINADAALGLDGELLGRNLFAYAFNNPVMHSDPSGRWPGVAVIAAGAIAAAAAVVVATTVALPVRSTITANVLSSDTSRFLSEVNSVTTVAFANIASVATSVIAQKQKIQETSQKRYSVYVLRDNGGDVQYVGRTTNVTARARAHASNPFRAGLSFEVVVSNLNYSQARGTEQVLMLYYHTINPQNKMNNQINGISPNNPHLDSYIKSAQGVLGYMWNQISNELLCWAGR